jgi:hypothetical protein
VSKPSPPVAWDEASDNDMVTPDAAFLQETIFEIAAPSMALIPLSPSSVSANSLPGIFSMEIRLSKQDQPVLYAPFRCNQAWTDNMGVA